MRERVGVANQYKHHFQVRWKMCAWQTKNVDWASARLTEFDKPAYRVLQAPVHSEAHCFFGCVTILQGAFTQGHQYARGTNAGDFSASQSTTTSSPISDSRPFHPCCLCAGCFVCIVFAGVCIRTLRGHAEGVWAVAALSAERVVSGSADNTLKVWDLRSGMPGCRCAVAGGLNASGLVRLVLPMVRAMRWRSITQRKTGTNS